MSSSTQIQSGSSAILQVGQRLFRDFNLDDPDRKSIYERMFYLLADSDRLASFGLKKGKGALLLGNIGVGKTVMMKTLQVIFKDTPRKFRWVNCLDFKDMIEEGMSALEIKQMYGKSFKCDLYIDDLGLGQADFRKYGNVTNIIAELIFERDQLFVDENFRTHFSSNVPTTVPNEAPPEVKSIERLYGDRVFDRMKQLTNVIEWKGKSLRK